MRLKGVLVNYEKYGTLSINVHSCSTYFWFPTSLGLFFETPDVTAGPDDVRDALFCSLDDKWG